MSAADRLTAFLDARSEMGGPIDHETILRIGVGGEVFDLLTSDLRTLLEDRRRYLSDRGDLLTLLDGWLP